MNDCKLHNAYMKTTFRVSYEEYFFDLQINQVCSDFDEFCLRKGITDWAIITAWNPGSQLLADSVNHQRSTELFKHLVQADYHVAAAQGIPENDEWAAEDSFFIWNISRRAAVEIGQTVGQNAVVCGSRDDQCELVYC